MADELTVVPSALASLRRQLANPEATLDDILLPLRALQRMGLEKADLRVHLERSRAVNDAIEQDDTVEENALLALDLVAGEIPGASLRWDPAEMAKIRLPGAIVIQELGRTIPAALAPHDMLPPRAAAQLPPHIRERMLDRLQARLRNFEVEPRRAEFFRVPKAGMTSRPAALLAPEDRLLYEGLADQVTSALQAFLPPPVVWPRPDDGDPSYEKFSMAPADWNQRYVVTADIESFYECIDHALLASFVGAHLKGKAAYLLALESFLDAVMGATVGLPQGPPASEVFASAYLLPVDVNISRAGWSYVRYADDLLVGADTITDGRRKIETLETALREIGLRLNVSKTKIMRTATYLGMLNKPSRRVERLRDQIRQIAENQLRRSEDSEEVESMLREVGVEEEVLWDLLYHRTTTLEEVLDEVRDKLRPPMVEAYGLYFERVARELRTGLFDEEIGSVEKDLRECLTFLASAKHSIDLKSVNQVLKWFPRLARHTAIYLRSIAPNAERDVAEMLRMWLKPGADTDWVTSWLCYVVESSPTLVSSGLEASLRRLARDRSVGLLTRTGAVRALAAAKRLDSVTWDQLLDDASPTIRSELILGRHADPDRYPDSPYAIEPGMTF
ncbi:RNA-directed DNA polymerase [Actinomycetes bacterium KLBMP 9797]